MKDDNKNIMDTQKILEKEIDLIQACINRMSQHSFYLKGWLVTLVGILLALKPADIILVNICLIFIAVAFWYLNATYLRYEKQYRELYKWVITERMQGNTDFVYELNLDIKERYVSKVEGRITLMFKNTLLGFYGTIVAILIIILIWMICKENIGNIVSSLDVQFNEINTMLKLILEKLNNK